MKSIKLWKNILLTLIAFIFGWPFILLFKKKRLLSRSNPCTSFHDAEGRIKHIEEKEKAEASGLVAATSKTGGKVKKKKPKPFYKM